MDDDLTFDQILAMLQGKYAGREAEGVMGGVGAKGLDTPAERDFLAKEFGSEESDSGLIDAVINYKNTNRKKFDYDFEVDGNTEGYTFTGDAPLSGQAIQNMRNIQGITADGQMKPNTSNLGLGAEAGASVGAMPEFMPGKTPTIPNVVPQGFHRMPDGTVMADGSMNYAGTGEMSPNPQTVDRTKFNTQFANLSATEQDRVKQLMSGMTDEQKAIFGAGLTGSPLNGYAVQDEGRY